MNLAKQPPLVGDFMDGRMGRWGNQLYQYAGPSTIAKELGAEFQCPHWVGETIFNNVQHSMNVSLSRYTERYGPDTSPIPPANADLLNRDAYGYFQWHTSWWTGERRSVWQRTFTPNDAWQERMAPAYDTFSRSGQTRIGIHVRRGDYGQGSVYDGITPVQWYLDWLAVNWPTFKEPSLFIASEDMALVREFAAYSPHTIESLGIVLQPKPYPFCYYLQPDLDKPHLLDFLPEWLMLRACRHLVLANSTYGFTAAMCSTEPVRIYRPCVAESRFIEEDVWNCLPLRKDCKTTK